MNPALDKPVCPACLGTVHDGIPCEDVTVPCKECAAVLTLGEQYQLADGTKPLCKECFERLKKGLD